MKCKYRVQLNAVSNKNIIQHWSTKHGFPAALKFLDIPTQDILSLENFFSFCLQVKIKIATWNFYFVRVLQIQL